MKGELVLFCVSVLFSKVFAKENCTEITCIPTSYDKSLTPQSYNPVSLDISDIEILNVNDYGKIVLQMVIRLFIQDYYSNICNHTIHKIILENSEAQFACSI